MKQKWSTVWKTAAALCLLAGVVSSVALSAMTLTSVRQMEDRERRLEQEAEEEKKPREDGVIIAEHYEVKPTTAISDAYLSGDTSALSDRERETLDMASEVLEEIIEDGMSDYEKERAVYDWMTSSLQNDSGLLTVIPTTQADCDNPYGVLKYHNAVCVGYATTFRLFMQMLEIDCMVVHNTGKYHTWDLVKLDGDWYHVDIYSDAGRGGYANFNLSDQLRGQYEDWDRSFYPAATGMRYNEGYRNMVTAEDVYQIPAQVRLALDEGKRILYLNFETEIQEEQAQISEQILQTITDRLCNLSAEQQGYLSWAWTRDPETQKYLLMVTIERSMEEDDSPVLDEQTQNKIWETVEDSFGDLEEDAMYWDDQIVGSAEGEMYVG